MAAVIIWGVIAVAGGLGLWLVLVGNVHVERVSEDEEN